MPTHRLIAVTLLLLFFWLAVASLVDDSPTMDEQNHIARGLALLKSADPRLSLEHPPLVNTLSALPVLTVPDLRLPFDHPSWQREPATHYWYLFAEQLFWHYNPERVTQIVFLARLPIVFLTIGLGLTALRFATALWHRRAGTAALLLVLFDPNIMAHGRYSTTDVGGAAFLLLAIFHLWKLWQLPPRHSRQIDPRLLRQWAIAALCLGCAFGAKLSSLTFVPGLALLAVLPLYNDRDGWHWQRAIGRLLRYLTAGAASLLVIHALFAFEWGAFRFTTEGLQPLNRFAGPMPTFWAGVAQIAQSADIGRQAFLLGHFSDNGFRSYFPVAFLVKTPLTTLWLLAIALLWLLNRRDSRPRAFFLLIPALLYFGSALNSGLNIGYRHLLPVLPLLFVLMAGLVPRQWRHDGRLTLRSFAVLVALGGSLVTTVLTHPHYLSYFNPLAGGPANGWRVLVDSNVDWGQELFRLREWMAENGVERVNLAYFGSADPARYVTYNPLPGEPRHRDLWWAVPFDRDNPAPGIYVISAHNLQEMPLRIEEKTVYAWFRQREPTARIGGSLLIYDVP
jgi:4-amino-4-deoxy-L-arabinose transferase-like glycosyltransferase